MNIGLYKEGSRRPIGRLLAIRVQMQLEAKTSVVIKSFFAAEIQIESKTIPSQKDINAVTSAFVIQE